MEGTRRPKRPGSFPIYILGIPRRQTTRGKFRTAKTRVWKY
jgi:hypothetical protein